MYCTANHQALKRDLSEREERRGEERRGEERRGEERRGEGNEIIKPRSCCYEDFFFCFLFFSSSS
jgi:hypothetical protein